MKSNRVAIVTTVLNHELYERTRTTYPSAYKLFKIDGKYGFYGVHSIRLVLKKLSHFDFVILVDEDVVFERNYFFDEIIQVMRERKIALIGPRDFDMGGKRWDGNPFSMNTFFTIINMTFYRSIKIDDFFENKAPLSDIEINEFCMDNRDFATQNILSMREPYYPFFLNSIRLGFPLKYLDCRQNFLHDEITTTIFDFDDKPVLHHTWYARAYHTAETQKKRIDRVVEKFEVNSIHRDYLLLNNALFSNIRLKYEYKRIKRMIKRLLFGKL